MPHIVTNFRMSFSLRHYYNVSFGVGRNRRNDPLDVLLVQFLLNLLPAQAGGRYFSPSLVTDGIFGPDTETAIGLFQASWNRGSGGARPRLEEDSVVSPGRGHVRPVPNRTWTILALNAVIAHERGVGVDMFCRLHSHPECPPRLRTFFASAPGRVPLPAGPPAPAPAPATQPGAANAIRPRYTLQELVQRARTPAPRYVRPPRPYQASDPGVQWASRILNPGRSLFSAYEWSEIMEVMEGTGDWEPHERWTILKHAVDFALGEPYLSGWPDLTIEEAQELMRQEVALGPLPRL